MITVGKDAKSQAGAKILAPYAFSFTIASDWVPSPPTIKGTSPIDLATDVPLDVNISIAFSKGMNRSETESAIAIFPAIAWSPAWSLGDALVTFTPSSNLKEITKYIVIIGKGAKSTDGANLANQHIFSFTTGIAIDATPPTVVATYPDNNTSDVDKATKVTITFSKAMDKLATAGSVSIAPGKIMNKTWSGNASLILTVLLEDGTKYTVTISTDARDLAGHQMKSPYTFTFTTKAAVRPPNLDSTGPMLLILTLLITIIVLAAIAILILVRKRKRQDSGPAQPQLTFQKKEIKAAPQLESPGASEKSMPPPPPS
jgi:hypothetical protein